MTPDPRAGLRETIRAVAEAGGLEVGAEVEENDEAVVVRLHGADVAFFLGEDGRGEVLRATEHLLLRLYGAALQPRALRLTCEGFRARRDEALAVEAHRLAEAVRTEGQPRTMEPMNAYERRVIHVALQSEPGVTTYSVGQGVGPPGDGRPGRRRGNGAGGTRRGRVSTGPPSRPSACGTTRAVAWRPTSTPWPPGAPGST